MTDCFSGIPTHHRCVGWDTCEYARSEKITNPAVEPWRILGCNCKKISKTDIFNIERLLCATSLWFELNTFCPHRQASGHLRALQNGWKKPLCSSVKMQEFVNMNAYSIYLKAREWNVNAISDNYSWQMHTHTCFTNKWLILVLFFMSGHKTACQEIQAVDLNLIFSLLGQQQKCMWILGNFGSRRGVPT